MKRRRPLATTGAAPPTATVPTTGPAPSSPVGARTIAAWHYGTCFLTGGAILVLEVLGFRMFAPFFGSSVYVTGTLVGIVLAALSLGYWIGGALADRRPEERVMYAAILGAAAYLGVVLLTYRALLTGLQTWGLVAGTVTAASTVFAPPMIALSVVSPYLVRLAAVDRHIGSVAGKMFSVSTVGSIAGSFLTTFVFVPTFGSHATLFGCVLLLVALGAGGIWRTTGRRSPALLALVLLVPPYTIVDPAVVFRTESAYNTIEIRDSKGLRSMVLNRSRWRQSYLVRPGDKSAETYREFFGLAPFLTDVKSVLILGASAGASLVELRGWFDVSIDAVDIDPEVLRLARDYFGVHEDERTRLLVADARPFLARAATQWDFIEIDLFHGGPELPFYVATKEFFTLARDRLTARGIVMMNVLGTLQPGLDEMVHAVGRTMASVFSRVYAVPFAANTLLIGTAHELELEALQDRLQHVSHPTLQRFAYEMRRRLKAVQADGPPLTDDLAPVEQMTHRLLLRLGEE
jgi:spermidine synthase